MEDMNSIIDRFKGLRILVVGDAMQDIYHFGRVDRISPEAPVPVFIEERQEVRRGGSDNVAHQLEEWGCEVSTFFAEKKSIKHRYLVGSHQLFRHDEDSSEAGNFGRWPGLSEDLQGVVLSDYSKGWCSLNLCQTIATQSKCPVVIDPKGNDWAKYYSPISLQRLVICPNEQEYLHADRSGFYDIVRKRGAAGITLYQGTHDYGRIPASAEEIPAHSVPVFDVTGAGDTVVAMIAAGLAAGADLRTSAIMANAAASVVVQKVGTSVCTLEELRCVLDSLPAVSTSPTADTGISSESANGSATTSSSPSTMTPTANE
jgi:bifunctional ADP-heptose synthase (sugar kinase/adenylyltransferase)